MKALFKTHPYALTGFVLALAVTLFFCGRIVTSAIYWANPAHHDESVRQWMTVGYIAKSWGVKPQDVDAMAHLPGPKGHGPWTMKQIARSRNVAVDEVIRQVNETVAKLKLQAVQP